MAISILYWGITLLGSDFYPRVWIDEGWIAEPGYTLATAGGFGNPSHGSIYRFDDRLYWNSPLKFLLLAGVYKLGLPAFAGGRYLSMFLGFGTVLLLCHGAMLLLSGDRSRRQEDSGGKSPQLGGGNPSRLGGGDLSRSGIANPKLWLGALLLWLALCITMDPTLWKSHRTIRFESLTAFCFALTWVSWLAVPWKWRGLAMGLGAGLAFLSHPAGALASGVTGFLFLTDPKPLATRLRQLGLAALTVVLCILPWALYLLGDREADFVNFLGQNAPHLDGRDHGLLEQMALERQRYLAYFPLPYLAFPLLATVVTLLAGLRFRASRIVLVPALTLILGLSLLPNKSELYLTLLMPFVYLMAATLAQRYPRWWVAALGGLWLAFYVAADFTLLKRHRSCDLNAWSAAVVDPIADGDSVAGSYLTWFALKDHEYVEYTRQRAGDVYDRRPTFVIWGGSITVQENFKRLREEMEPLLAQYGEQIAATDSSSCYGKLTLFRPHWDAIPADFAESLERYGDQE